MRITGHRDLVRSAAFLIALSTAIAFGMPRAADAAVLTMRVAEAADAPVNDAVVYAVPKVASTKPPAPAEISQVDRQFKPVVTVAQTGASISFPNRDTVRHQIYSFSPAKVFELKLYSGVPAAPIVFDKAGLVVLGCNIHDEMVAYVLIVDTPYFGKTTADGVVRIDVPAGDYTISVWHPRLRGQSPPRPVSVTGDVRLDTVVALEP